MQSVQLHQSVNYQAVTITLQVAVDQEMTVTIFLQVVLVAAVQVETMLLVLLEQ